MHWATAAIDNCQITKKCRTEFQSLDEMKGPPSRSPLHPLYYCTEYGVRASICTLQPSTLPGARPIENHGASRIGDEGLAWLNGPPAASTSLARTPNPAIFGFNASGCCALVQVVPTWGKLCGTLETNQRDGAQRLVDWTLAVPIVWNETPQSQPCQAVWRLLFNAITKTQRHRPGVMESVERDPELPFKTRHIVHIVSYEFFDPKPPSLEAHVAAMGW